MTTLTHRPHTALLVIDVQNDVVGHHQQGLTAPRPGNWLAMESEHPAPLIQPPRLRTEEPERNASRLELFFDLAYVLVVAELAVRFSKHPDWHGALVFAGLFIVAWWSWVTTTLYANRFDTNDIIYRIAKLGGTVAVMAMAASAIDATGSKADVFAASYLATRVLLLALYARAYRHVDNARTTIGIYLVGTGAGAALWAVSLVVPDTLRYVLWAAGVLFEAIAPFAVTRFGGGVPLHLDHLPERFGLFVMLVLGESVASVVLGVHDTHWTALPAATAAVAFIVVAALWWIYFDLGGAAGKRRLITDGQDGESGVADAYVFGHLPVTLGLAMTAVGIEAFILHPADDLPSGGRWALLLGVALFLAGTAAVLAGTSRDWRAAWPWPFLAIPAVLALGLFRTFPPMITLAAAGAILVATVLAGIVEQRRGALETTET
jgi:low temperature requirement protein LtrA